MSQYNVEIQEDEIDLKDILRTIFHYKYMIIFLVILFGLGSAYYAYFKPNVYKASTTVEVGLKGSSTSDVISMALDSGAQTQNTATEMVIIKSRFLAEKALKKVDFSHRYYTTRKYKEIELYKDAPFQVGMVKGFDISFYLYPIDEKSYRLVVEETVDENGNIWSYDEILLYAKEIITEHFHLNIVKTNATKDERYRFVILKNGFPQGNVNVRPMSTILEISYSDNVPLRAQEFTNALAKAYIEQNVEKKTKEATRKLAFIDKQLKFITENLKSSAVKLEDFKKSQNTVNISAKAEKLITRMAEYETKMEEIKMQLEMLDIINKKIKSGKKIESIVILSGSTAEATISTMLKQLQTAIMKKKSLREDYTEMFPAVVKLSKQIKQFKKIIASTIQNLINSVNEKKALIEKSIIKQQKLLNKLPANERKYGQLERKFMINDKIYSYLLEQRLATSIVKAATVSQNRVLDSALLPKGAIAPKRKMIVLTGVIIGLILGLLLAFLRGYLDNRINREEDITRETLIPIFGTVPHFKDHQDKILVFSKPKSALAESFRHIRTNLQFTAKKDTCHIIAMTSTVGGEGKTSICINLGGIFSMTNKKTIILNLDMRKPTLHQRLGLENGKGMSTLLSGHTGLSDVIQHTEYSNLDIIASGPIPPNPSELIQSELMIKLLEKLREIYDVVILDTPPVGLVTDARTLMHLADTTMYVVRSDYSKKDYLRTIDELYRTKQLASVGIVFNDIKMDKSKYGYGYGYGYGYYEEDKK